MCQAALQSRNNRLGAIVDFKALQDRADMTLDCGLGDSQHAGNLFVAVSSNHQVQHLPFAGAQVRVRYTGSQGSSHRWWKETTSAMDLQHRVDQGLVRHSLDDV